MIRFSALFIFLAILTALAPPGLCPCWLNPEVKTVHPHLSEKQAESEHSHDYLLQISQTNGIEMIPSMITPATVWIALAFAGSIWWLWWRQY